MTSRWLPLVALVGVCAACSGAHEPPGALLSPEHVSSAGHDPLAPLTIVDTEEPEACGLAFDVPAELLAEGTRAAARWSAATGCDVRVEAGGVPVTAWAFVFVDDAANTVHHSDPQLTRREVCGATVTHLEHGPQHIYVATEAESCDVADALVHEMGHSLGPAGEHAPDGVCAPGRDARYTPSITAGSLAWVCSELACRTFEPEISER